MSEKVIQEGNILIAAFEQRKFSGKHTIDKYGGDTANALPEMKYHESWDWLLSAAKKFGAMPSTFESKIRWDEFINIGLASLEIKLAWRMFVELIQWYNKNK